MSDQIGIMRSQIIVEIKTYNIFLQRQQRQKQEERQQQQQERQERQERQEQEERQQRQPQQDQQQQISQVPMHGKLFIEKSFFLWLNLF